MSAESRRCGPARPPRVLIDGGFERPSYSTYDVGLDGRFLMIEPAELGADAGRIAVVFGWAELLEQRVTASS